MSRDTARALTQFFGGRICLDFANTMDWRTSDEPHELIPDYATFLSWSKGRGTLAARTLARLSALAKQRVAAAEAVTKEARALRGDIWKVSDALRRSSRPNLEAINDRLASVPAQPKLIRGENGYVHDLPGNELGEIVWPVLWSLTALLSSDDAGRLGCCHAEGCGWFFVDESPNRSRMWCSSEVCGNRERARRAYAKRRKATG